MAHGRRFSHLLDGVGAIFAPKPRGKDHDQKHRRRPDYDDYDNDAYRPRSSRRARRGTYDHSQRYSHPEPSPVDAPDADHLRQARAEYYARPQDQRYRRPSAPAATSSAQHNMEPRLTRAASTRKNSKSKRHDVDRKPSRKEREDRDSGVFVYSTPRSGGSRSRPVDSREEDLGDSRSRPGAHRRTVSSPAANVIDVEVEKEPDPSVRRADGVRLSRTTSARDQNRPAMTRPSLRRTGTIKSPAADAPPATPASHHNRRNSGIFALFRPVPTQQTPEKKYGCMICLDEVRASRCPRLSCGHRMCHTCLKRQFELSVRDPQHMPPRCCTNDHIPLKYVDRIFDTKFKVLWNKKYQEYTAKNRIYCPTRGCGEWIKPSHIRVDPTVGRKYGKCPRCRGKVCVKCNGRWHLRKECPKDEDAQQFATMAKESGWQQCYNCKAMVELKEGCNHMTCRCTAQFCMLCGAKWKTCECPWFNYAHLDEEDRLQNMRVPEPYVVVEHDVRGNAPPPRAPPNARPDQYAVPAPRQNHPVYAPAAGAGPAYPRARDPDREREDEMLARRLQSQYLAEGTGQRGSGSRAGGSRAGETRRHHHHRHRTAPSRYESPEIEIEVVGVGNAAGHHMNDFGAPAAAAAAAPRAPRSTIIRRTTTRRATEADRQTARNMGYGAYGGQAPAQQAQASGAARAARPVEASVMAGLSDPARSGMGRVGMWLNYVEDDPAEVEGRAQRAQGVMAY